MILFIGSPDRGYFVEEYAKQVDIPFNYVLQSPKIEMQISSILRNVNTDCMVFDIDQYVDDAKEITKVITNIQGANNARVIIYAGGYLPTSNLTVELANSGIKNFIFAVNLYDMKIELEKCISGYYDQQGNDLISEAIEELKEEENKRKAVNSKLIGVAGACERIGTTTQCIQLIKSLKLRGYKACYIEMNGTDYFRDYMEEFLTCDEWDKDLGKIIIAQIDHYYKIEKLPEILSRDYDYFIYDFGYYKEANFNKTSFLEKDVRILVLGSKPGEISKSSELIANTFYADCAYIFNFTPENEQEDLLEMMEEKKERTFFSPEARDKYILADTDIYEQLIAVDYKEGMKPEEPKKFSIFGKRKKKG